MIFADVTSLAEYLIEDIYITDNEKSIYVVSKYDVLAELAKELLTYDKTSVDNINILDFQTKSYENEYVLVINSDLYLNILEICDLERDIVNIMDDDNDRILIDKDLALSTKCEDEFIFELEY